MPTTVHCSTVPESSSSGSGRLTWTSIGPKVAANDTTAARTSSQRYRDFASASSRAGNRKSGRRGASSMRPPVAAARTPRMVRKATQKTRRCWSSSGWRTKNVKIPVTAKTPSARMSIIARTTSSPRRPKSVVAVPIPARSPRRPSSCRNRASHAAPTRRITVMPRSMSTMSDGSRSPVRRSMTNRAAYGRSGPAAIISPSR